jgi:hypothetical protein
MARDLGILIVHGMGSQPASFSDGLREELTDRLRILGADPGRIAWQACLWAEELESREADLWTDLAMDTLGWRRLRRFVVAALGDALAYRVVGTSHTSIYVGVHQRVRRALDDLRSELGGVDKPLVVLAHSLGAHVISNHAWDARNKGYPGSNPAEWTPFERLESMVLFVTFGCNIPLFTLALDSIEAIPFPPPELPQSLKRVAKWLNFYDEDDVLGYPLRRLSPSYELSVTDDIEVNVGGFGASMSPLSHARYWRDASFTRPVSEGIAHILDAL